MSKIQEIKRQISLSMNGICAEKFRESGMGYKKCFGVDWVRLREIASEFEQDYDTAVELWSSDVREHKLIATLICPAAEMNAERVREWAEGLVNTETAEILSFALVSRVQNIVTELIEMENSDKDLERLLAYHALGRKKNFTTELTDAEQDKAVKSIKEQDRQDLRFHHAIRALEE